ncbi:hypothetical protein Emtol_2502 [Emticicia oligotrophica DSM 17448]|uniref:Uncharacterized protein n=1 Tax=Emticicia oligotrophica (strain DSM 17448 / CIP 109782 / MTCC 6937 / GPTSA100-15) TaxID=929562 RepID=A0ABN4ANC0_EMTOG|nr:hypothetical protein Emtol_2502 [Emticicia oligotrophica DSM 17448]
MSERFKYLPIIYAEHYQLFKLSEIFLESYYLAKSSSNLV